MPDPACDETRNEEEKSEEEKSEERRQRRSAAIINKWQRSAKDEAVLLAQSRDLLRAAIQCPNGHVSYAYDGSLVDPRQNRCPRCPLESEARHTPRSQSEAAKQRSADLQQWKDDVRAYRALVARGVIPDDPSCGGLINADLNAALDLQASNAIADPDQREKMLAVGQCWMCATGAVAGWNNHFSALCSDCAKEQYWLLFMHRRGTAGTRSASNTPFKGAAFASIRELPRDMVHRKQVRFTKEERRKQLLRELQPLSEATLQFNRAVNAARLEWAADNQDAVLDVTAPINANKLSAGNGRKGGVF